MMTPCYEGPRRRIVRTSSCMQPRKWQPTPFFRENVWFPDCPATRPPHFVSGPVPGPAWPLALQQAHTHLILKPLSPPLDSVYSWAGPLQKSKLHVGIRTCMKMPFMTPNWTSIHTGVSARTAPVVAFQLSPTVTDRTRAPWSSPFPLRCLLQLQEWVLDRNLGLHPVGWTLPSYSRTSAH